MRNILLFAMTLFTLNATTPTYENVTRLYVATFDRTPDVVGLKYWVNDSGLSLENIARSFFDQPETKAKYYPNGTLYVPSFVEEVYINLFDRLPDSAGKQYWVDEIMAGGFSQASVFILAVINGAQGNDATIVANKTKTALDEISDQLDEGHIDNTQVCPTFAKFDYYMGDSSDTVRWFCRYHDGRLYSERQYINGKQEGPYHSYYPNGDLEFSGNLLDARRVGIWIHYLENGSKECQDNDTGLALNPWYSC